MRLVPLEKLKLGDILGKTLYTGDGQMLLGRGVTLTGTFISKLNQLGVRGVYIEDKQFADVQVEETLSDRVRMDAMRRIREMKDAIKLPPSRKKRGPDLMDSRLLKRTAADIIEDVLSKGKAVHNLVELHGLDDWFVTHSVQVALISVIIGQAMGLDKLKLEELAVGAMLHDVGMSEVPNHLYNKSPEKYTPEELRLYESHAQEGFDYLRKKTDLSVVACHVAFQHHERVDGSGFPRGLSGDQIHLYARIAAVADAYDQLVTGTHGRPPLPPHEVFEVIMGLSGKAFDFQVVDAFTRHVAAYPTGYTVRLNNGEVAVVIGQNALSTRPKVRVLWEYEEHLEVVEHDLCKNLTLSIQELIL